MGKIQVLDCTLRDGGYCNQWKFGQNNIPKIIMGLEESGVEIIECGFLNNHIVYDNNCTRYNSIEQAEQFISNEQREVKYVCMANYGDFDVEQLPFYAGGAIEGIRVAFHKADVKNALRMCAEIQSKGYKVYIQPMVVLDYSDEEFLALVHEANALHPYAFYIVDSFGVMKKKELIHIFYMIENNLDEDIWIGFHSHNNMQLSFANSNVLLELQGNRNIIIDASIFGMGRGAGNLNTELFLQYLNENYSGNYNVSYLLDIYDEILSVFYNQKNWGYSLANYLSASYNCHPNYANFLDEKNTLAVSDLNKIFKLLDPQKKNKFDKSYAEELYLKYMSKNIKQQSNIDEFRTKVSERSILLIASGKSSRTEKDRIVEFIKENNCLVISINTDYEFHDVDYVFVSNIRRYRQIDKILKNKMIVTSNIMCDESYMTLEYDLYTNNKETVADNAALMLLAFLKEEGVQEINIAGLDGYSHDLTENYADAEMIIKTRDEIFDKRNEEMNEFIGELSEVMKINFVTQEKYIFV